jgi:hypothetical protein
MKLARLVSIIMFSILTLFYSCEKNDPFIKVTDVFIDKGFVTMVESNALKLNAVVSPSSATNKKLKWTSSNDSVVTVDVNGLLTAHKKGVAVVIVVTEDGSKTATSNINVREGWITLSQRVIESAVTGGTFNIKISASNDWNVTSQPQWISVSPTSGIGNNVDSTTIAVLVNQIDAATLVRSGSVIFKINDRAYADTLLINQYNYSFSDGDYETIHSSLVGDGIDLVFVGDGYTIEEVKQGKYKNNLVEAIDHFFNIEPYRTYRSYFDAHIVYAFSKESGISDQNNTKDTKFSAKYESTNSTSMSVDHNISFKYARKAPLSSNLTETLIIVITNSSRFAGTNWFYSDGRSISIIPRSDSPYPNDFRGVVQHEAGGHGFGRLSDEYGISNTTISTISINELKMWQGWGYFRNVDVTNDVNSILWKHLIADPAYSYVGAYEGGYTYDTGVWRSEPSSIMNNNIPYFNASSRELIVKQIMNLAGENFSFQEFKLKDVRETQALSLGVKPDIDEALRLPPPVLIRVD